MIKLNIITNYLADTNEESIDGDEVDIHDEDVHLSLKKLEEEGHAVISINTITFGRYSDWMRTEITYREIQTRKVITEKTKKINGSNNR